MNGIAEVRSLPGIAVGAGAGAPEDDYDDDVPKVYCASWSWFVIRKHCLFCFCHALAGARGGLDTNF